MNTEHSVSEKYVLILGAMSDVARALAKEYASHGYHIIAAARDEKRLIPLTHDINIRFGVKTFAIPFDAEQTSTHANFYESLPTSPDVVITAFGYLGNTEKGLSDWEEAARIIQVNYTGAVSILNRIAIDMRQKKRGLIIGISSVAGERGRQSNFLYGSAKSGFSAYLSGLRNMLYPHQVHVLTVKPGFIRTSMTEGMPLNPKLTANPEQVARSIYAAGEKKKNTLYVLWMWKYIMCMIRNIPESVFKKMKL
ncbi:MAG: SDR family oxidoreductase [Candidatus Competibacteraceae bacterium]|nr:SDR family oxidoreductase [Candidatus Competibacteraceae bacterium]